MSTENQIEQNPEINKEPEGQSISGLVNEEFVAILLSMGYSKNVAEKALFLKKNNFDEAMEWIYCNQGEQDFEEELRILEKCQEPKSKLSDEEAYKKAKELQEKARKIIKEKEEENERISAMKRIEESIKLTFILFLKTFQLF